MNEEDIKAALEAERVSARKAIDAAYQRGKIDGASEERMVWEARLNQLLAKVQAYPHEPPWDWRGLARANGMREAVAIMKGSRL
jgi:hypothetical protein